MLITLKFWLFKSLADAIPNAAEIDVEACPAPKTSYSLSLCFKNGFKPLYFLMVLRDSNLPVSTLWAYA